MNKLVVVAKNPETYFIERLRHEVGNALSIFNPWADFSIPEADHYLVRTTGVYGADLDLHLLATLPPERIINPLLGLKIFRSKVIQYPWLEEHGFQVPDWISLKGQSELNVEKFFRLFPHALVKPHIGQGGWGIEGMDWPKFKTWWKKKKGTDESYLLQRFLPDSLEMRVFFIQGQEEIVLERRSKSGIAANFKQQGLAKSSSLPEILRPEVLRLIQKSGLFYGAIDLLIHEKNLYFLEVNSVPGIEQLESLTGQNVMKKLLSAKFFSQFY